MRPIAQRARTRAAQVDPRRKRGINELLRRNREVERLLEGAISATGGPVLGVGMFSLPVARTLLRHGADIADDRAGNTDANLFCDLPPGGDALNGPYELVVSQDGLCGTPEPEAVVESLTGRLPAGGRLLVVFSGAAVTSANIRRLRPSVRQRIMRADQPILVLDRVVS